MRTNTQPPSVRQQTHTLALTHTHTPTQIRRAHAAHHEVVGLVRHAARVVLHRERSVGALGLAEAARVLARGGGVQLLRQVRTRGGWEPASARVSECVCVCVCASVCVRACVLCECVCEDSRRTPPGTMNEASAGGHAGAAAVQAAATESATVEASIRGRARRLQARA